MRKSFKDENMIKTNQLAKPVMVQGYG